MCNLLTIIWIEVSFLQYPHWIFKYIGSRFWLIKIKCTIAIRLEFGDKSWWRQNLHENTLHRILTGSIYYWSFNALSGPLEYGEMETKQHSPANRNLESGRQHEKEYDRKYHHKRPATGGLPTISRVYGKPRIISRWGFSVGILTKESCLEARFSGISGQVSIPYTEANPRSKQTCKIWF